jgi:hypothetical protein
MGDYYCVNNDHTRNPGLHHEVHTERHAKYLGIRNRTYLGYFEDCHSAVAKAKLFYADADGCAVCCPECHKG